MLKEREVAGSTWFTDARGPSSFFPGTGPVCRLSSAVLVGGRAIVIRHQCACREGTEAPKGRGRPGKNRATKGPRCFDHEVCCLLVATVAPSQAWKVSYRRRAPRRRRRSSLTTAAPGSCTPTTGTRLPSPVDASSHLLLSLPPLTAHRWECRSSAWRNCLSTCSGPSQNGACRHHPFQRFATCLSNTPPVYR